MGAGPAGLYAAEECLRRGAEVDVFEQSFAPFGVVRSRVAPDHQNIKRRAALPEYIFEPGRFHSGTARYFGNVQIGRDLTLDELRRGYDAVLLATGSERTRDLGIAGESRPGSWAASDFAAWYNGSPEGVRFDPQLDCERAVVIGAGHLALDVARLLARHPSELEPTDIAPHALRALTKSRIREVVVLARRGPDQALFDEKELRDLLDLVGVQLGVAGVGPTLRESVATKRGELLVELPEARAVGRRWPLGASRRIVFRFCSSPVALLGVSARDSDAPVHALRYELNELVDSSDGMRAAGTGRFADLQTSLVVRAIGSMPRPIRDAPWGTGALVSEGGRVLDGAGGRALDRLYAAGSLASGPVSSLEANRHSAQEAVQGLFDDLRARGACHSAQLGDLASLLFARGAAFLTWSDWQKLDQCELVQGQAAGKIRQKILSLSDALHELGDPRSEVRMSPAEAIEKREEAPAWAG